MAAFEGILSSYLDTKYQPPIRRYICPVDAYPLEDVDGKGLHCRNCGWQENPSIKFIPRVPETPA